MDLGIEGLGDATEVGAGASAIVYKARQLDLDREVAIKVLSVTDDAFVRRFKREAKTLGKLSQNPGIVTVYDTGVTGAGQPFLILELCESSLLDQLKANGPFGPRQACRVMAEVADAVAAAHEGGVVHRDLKPGNVLQSPLGRYMVTDFGISTVTGATMGQTNSVGFTAGYVAPETLTGEDAATPADVYALGATLFHVIAGKAPFVNAEKNSNLLALAQRVINDPVPDLRDQGVEDGICQVVELSMAKDPAARPTASELAVLLRTVADGREPDLGGVGGAAAAGAGVNETVADAATDENPRLDVATGEALEVEAVGDEQHTLESVEATPAAEADGAAVDATSVLTSPTPAIVAHAANGAAAAPATYARPMGDNGLLAPPALVGPPAPVGPPAGPTQHDRRYMFTEDDRRRYAPIVLGAVVALLALLGLGVPLIIGGAGEESTEAEDEEQSVVAGPEIELDEAEAFSQDDDSGRGSLGGSSTTLAGRVRVPNVLGFGASSAEAQLERLGFEVNRVDEESATVPRGNVIRTDPGPGRSAEVGSIITIFVSTERPRATVEVPPLGGQPREEAEAALDDLGLTSTVSTDYSPTVAEGLVISSRPEPGTTVNVGSSVELIVSRGPICAAQTGLSEAAATANLEAAGLTVTSSRQPNATVDEGDVVSCTRTGDNAALVVSSGPPNDLCGQAIGMRLDAARELLEGAGLTVDASGAHGGDPADEVTACTISGTTAAVTYSLGPLPSCPPVIGMTEANAIAALNAAGFTTVDVTTEASSTAPPGTVISCTTKSATAATIVVASGSTVTVPDVTDLSVTAASARIQAEGLVVGTTTTTPSQKPAGTVVRTNPAAGTSVPSGSTVNLVVSDGPTTDVPVPNVMGRTPAAARNLIEGRGLAMAIVQNDVGPGASGLVSAQSPAPGTLVRPGSTVTVTVDVDGSSGAGGGGP